MSWSPGSASFSRLLILILGFIWSLGAHAQVIQPFSQFRSPHSSLSGANLLQITHVQSPLCMDGTVKEITPDPATGIVYIGGSFTYITRCTGALAIFDKNNPNKMLANAVQSFPEVAGEIRTVIPDGYGGWYIGGLFTHINGVARANLARINSDYSLDVLFNPSTNNYVYSLALRSGILYVGGTYTQINSTDRRYLASIDAITGVLTGWDPKISNSVFALKMDGDMLYIGGDFMGFDTVYQQSIFVDTVTGQPKSGFPILTGSNHKVISDGSDGFFISGSLSIPNGSEYCCLHHILSDGSRDSNFNPTYYPPSSLRAMALKGTELWIMGAITQINDTNRMGVGAVSTVDGSLVGTKDYCVPSVDDGVFVGDVLYLRANDMYTIGGDCTQKNLVQVEASTGNVVASFPSFDGAVEAVVDDGSGGWFVGGHFTVVGGFTIPNLVHIKSDYSVNETWIPSPSHGVYSLAREGTTLYTGGQFSITSGVERQRIASYDIADFNNITLTSWDPNVAYSSSTANITEIVSANGRVAVRGFFDSIGGLNRTCLAVIDSITGTPTNFNPSFNTCAVYDIALEGDTLYVVGSFTSINSTTRNRAAAFDLATGALNSWAPSVSNYVTAMRINPSSIYLSGGFTQVNGSTRNFYAEVNKTTGGLLGVNLTHYTCCGGSIAQVGSTVYVGGTRMFYLNSTLYAQLYAFDPSTGSSVSWSGAASNTSGLKLFENGSNIIVYGNFKGYGGSRRRRVAAIDTSTETIHSWNPAPWVGGSTSGALYSIASDGTNVYIGGQFDRINFNTLRTNMASFVASTGAATSFNPSPNSTVTTIHAAPSELIVSGYFTTISSTSRSRLASYTLPGLSLTSWAPTMSTSLSHISDANGNLFLSGSFSTFGSKQRLGLAVVQQGQTEPIDWISAANYYVDRAVPSGTNTCLVGAFSTTAYSTKGRYRLASVDLTTHEPTNFDGHMNSQVYAVDTTATGIYAGGNFFTAQGLARNRIAEFQKSDGIVTSWNPSSNGTVRTLTNDGTNLYVGGVFSSIGGASRNSLASFALSNGSLTSWDPNVDGTVEAIYIGTDKVYVGGDFSNVSSQPRRSIASFTKSTGSLDSWNPGANGKVYYVLEDDSEIIVAGDIGGIQGVYRPGIAALDDFTGNLTAWNVSLVGDEIESTGDIRSMVVTGNDMYIAGNFTQAAGVTRNGVAKLNKITGALDGSWDPNADSSVYTLTLDGTTMFLGGDFSTIGGLSRSRVAQVNLTNGAPTGWSVPAISGSIETIVVDGSNVITGGSFWSVGGDSSYGYLAAFDKGTGALISGWQPHAKDGVYALKIEGSKLLVGGAIQSNLDHWGYGELTLSSGSFDAPTIVPSTEIGSLDTLGSTVYFSGIYNQWEITDLYTTQSRWGFAAFDRITHTTSSWNPESNSGEGKKVRIYNNKVYLSGSFSSLKGKPRRKFGVVNTTTGDLVH